MLYHAVLTFTMSSCGIPSVIHTTNPIPASIASMIAAEAFLGGTKMIEAFAPVCSTACYYKHYYTHKILTVD